MINRRAITIILTLANLCLFVSFVSGWVKPSSQSKKMIIRRLTLTKEPVDISYDLKGQPIDLSEAVRTDEGFRAQEFEGDADWVKDLTLRLRNTSGKTITYIQVNLHFPEVTRNGQTALQLIFLGVDPGPKFSRPALRLAPNEEVEIPLTERYDNIRTLV